MARSVALYSAVDDMFTQYAVDVDSATLVRKETVRTPAKVQYAWRHPSQPYLYVSTSNGARGSNPTTTMSVLLVSARMAHCLCMAKAGNCRVAPCICAWILRAAIS